jgi:hypothetical protein
VLEKSHFLPFLSVFWVFSGGGWRWFSAQCLSDLRSAERSPTVQTGAKPGRRLRIGSRAFRGSSGGVYELFGHRSRFEGAGLMQRMPPLRLHLAGRETGKERFFRKNSRVRTLWF